METKIIKDEHKDMLKEFINRSFMPNHMNNSFKNIFYKSLESLNKTLLLSDLKRLYINRDFPLFLKKDCKIIFIKSENDFILDNVSTNYFLFSHSTFYYPFSLLSLLSKISYKFRLFKQ